MCDHRGPFDTGQMPCTRDHDDDTGHTYASSWAADGTHDDNPTDH